MEASDARLKLLSPAGIGNGTPENKQAIQRRENQFNKKKNFLQIIEINIKKKAENYVNTQQDGQHLWTENIKQSGPMNGENEHCGKTCVYRFDTNEVTRIL